MNSTRRGRQVPALDPIGDADEGRMALRRAYPGSLPISAVPCDGVTVSRVVADELRSRGEAAYDGPRAVVYVPVRMAAV